MLGAFPTLYERAAWGFFPALSGLAIRTEWDVVLRWFAQYFVSVGQVVTVLLGLAIVIWRRRALFFVGVGHVLAGSIVGMFFCWLMWTRRAQTGWTLWLGGSFGVSVAYSLIEELFPLALAAVALWLLLRGDRVAGPRDDRLYQRQWTIALTASVLAFRPVLTSIGIATAPHFAELVAASSWLLLGALWGVALLWFYWTGRHPILTLTALVAGFYITVCAHSMLKWTPPLWRPLRLFEMGFPIVFTVLATIPYFFLKNGDNPGVCRCGYDLSGNTSGTCPECGAEVTATGL